MAEQGFRKWIIVITVISAAVIELIDTSIVNVALSDMSASLGATIEDVAWVITSYAIASGIPLLNWSYSALFRAWAEGHCFQPLSRFSSIRFRSKNGPRQRRSLASAS